MKTLQVSALRKKRDELSKQSAQEREWIAILAQASEVHKQELYLLQESLTQAQLVSITFGTSV